MFPEDIADILEGRGLLKRAESFVRDHERSAFRVSARRVSERPLRSGVFDKLLGKAPAAPRLGVRASKWGGTPYHEGEGLEAGHDFLGQLNFADLPGAKANLPEQGILSLWVPHDMLELGLTTRWYPTPEHCEPVVAMSVGKWEAQLVFEPIPTYPEGDLWMSFLSGSEIDEELEQVWSDARESIGEWADHQLGGWLRAGLYDNYGFETGDEQSPEIGDWEMVLSISYDNEAGFGWGSNVVYVVATREALGASDLSGVVVTAANY